MADNRKEQERAELHRVIWDIACNIVHAGTVDQSEFKQYVLGVMFYRYISENLTEYVNQIEQAAGNADFDYSKMTDEQAESAKKLLINKKGFFILPSELFCNVQEKAAADDNLNETLAQIFKNIENSAQGTESENDFKGLFDDVDVNSNKLGGTVTERNKTLVMLLDGIAKMKLGNYQDTTIDVFGDAYEYLISMYASSAGKKGGEFYTPQEVSELLTRITLVGKTEVNKVYDPAVGSGSLLLNFAKILGKDNVRQGFFGQEKNITTYNLCRINMFLHNISYDKFNIAHGDTLINPQHWDDEPFEAIVSNPPFATKWEGDANPVLINDPRFSPAGILAPKGNADFAFIMHSLSWLATNGTAAIVCFPGIMYRSGAEKKIRQYLIDNNYIDAIIQLPSNLFFNTPIATCIMVLKKSKSENKTLFVDASKEFIKVTNGNKLTSENVETILNSYIERADKEYISRLVHNAEIEENDYNLTVSTYIEQEDTREKIDIEKVYAEIGKSYVKCQALMQDTNREQFEQKEKYIKNLINQLCSNGVEYKSIGDVSDIKRGVRVIKKQLAITGNYPVYQNSLTPLGYYEKSNCLANTTFIICAGAAGEIGFSTSAFWAADDCTYFICSENLQSRYLYYTLMYNKAYIISRVRRASIPRLPRYEIEKLKIPVPPLEVQQEIVNILDKFSELQKQLQNQLNILSQTKEKQYTDFADKLLTFKAVCE